MLGAAQAVCHRRESLQELPRTPAARMGQDPDEPGQCIWMLGERESGTARLEEAVAAYREALQENTRERVPLDWAGIQIISAMHSGRSASGRAGRRGSKKPSPPIAKPCRNRPARACRSDGP